MKIMKINTRAASAAAIITTLTFTSYAWGDCNTERAETLAASEYELSGQGNLSCAALNMSQDLTDAAEIIINGDNSISVKSELEFDAVVVKPSNGNRCIYNYPTIAMEANGLTPGGNKSISDVIICSDEITGIIVAEPEEPPPPPTLPVTTASNSCTGEILIEGSNILGGQEAVVVAETIDGQIVASCSVTADSGQEFCEDRCVNFRDVGESADCLFSVNDYTDGSTTNNTGEYSLEACKPCLTALDVKAGLGQSFGVLTPALHPDQTGYTPEIPRYMEYCWEKVNSAYEGINDLGGEPPVIVGGVPRAEGTMLKHTPVRQSETSITWYNKCYKTKVSVNGRDYWTTTCR